jgi:hypothetical protein
VEKGCTFVWDVDLRAGRGNIRFGTAAGGSMSGAAAAAGGSTGNGVGGFPFKVNCQLIAEEYGAAAAPHSTHLATLQLISVCVRLCVCGV